MAPTTTDQSSVLNVRNFDDQNNTVAEGLSDALKLGLDLLDDTGLAAKADLIRRIPLTGATKDESGDNTRDSPFNTPTI